MMSKFYFLTISIVINFQLLYCQNPIISKTEIATYNAGVVEFPPSDIINSKMNYKDNIRRIREIIESNNNLDILVFPEGISNNYDYKTYIPDPKDKIVPCTETDYDNFLATISCATRASKVYVILSVIEKAKGGKTYNTNVVFDRNGAVISRYRKTHLYRNEWQYTDVLPKPEFAIFKTDFNVTFAHFICFDMLFYEPAQKLVKELNITNIVYPTMWFSELPFLTAIQLQESWAYANNVNLLAANANSPNLQNSGSGIYAGKKGRYTSFVTETSETKILKAVVYKRPDDAIIVPHQIPQISYITPRLTKLNLLRDYNIDIFNTKLTEENFVEFNEKVCHYDFCCQFNIKRSLTPGQPAAYQTYRYRAVAYSGKETTFQRVDRSELSICAVIACVNDELVTCGRIYPETIKIGNKYYFTELNVSGIFKKQQRELIMPTSVDGEMLPLTVNMYNVVEIPASTGKIVMKMELLAPKADLLTFGIWSNHYTDRKSKHDLDKYFENGAVQILTQKILWLLFITLTFLFFAIN